jgi:hypothetical protein
VIYTFRFARLRLDDDEETRRFVNPFVLSAGGVLWETIESASSPLSRVKKTLLVRRRPDFNTHTHVLSVVVCDDFPSSREVVVGRVLVSPSSRAMMNDGTRRRKKERKKEASESFFFPLFSFFFGREKKKKRRGGGQKFFVLFVKRFLFFCLLF